VTIILQILFYGNIDYGRVILLSFEYLFSMSTEQRVASITGTVLRLNGKKLKGSELTLFLIAKNEHGGAVEIPFGAEETITVKVKTSGGMKKVRQYCGNLQVKAPHVETIIAQGDVHVNARTIGNLVANQTLLGQTQEIGTCFTGCLGAHINDQHKSVTVRKSTRNPFEEECALEIGPILSQSVAKFQQLSTSTINLPRQ